MPGNGLRLWHRMLATPEPMAAGGRVAAHPRNTADRIASARPNRFGACSRRQLFCASHVRWKKTGPSPVDRRKLGSKHHLITEQKGIPLAAILTGANTNDVTQLLPLLEA